MPKVVEVLARSKWNDTGLDIVCGQTVRIIADGQWIDSSIPASPEGFEKSWLNLARFTRRLPSAPWFCLCATVDRMKRPIHRTGPIRSCTAATGGMTRRSRASRASRASALPLDAWQACRQHPPSRSPPAKSRGLGRPTAIAAFLVITACLIGIAPPQANPERNSYVDAEEQEGGLSGQIIGDDSDASMVLGLFDRASLHDTTVAQTEFGRHVRVPKPLLPLTSADP